MGEEGILTHEQVRVLCAHQREGVQCISIDENRDQIARVVLTLQVSLRMLQQTLRQRLDPLVPMGGTQEVSS